MDVDRIRDFCAERNYGFESSGSNPRLLLIGEVHSDESHFIAQEEMIKMISPRAVLHEFYDSTSKHLFSFVDKWEDGAHHYKMNHLGELSKKLGFDLLSGDIPFSEQSSLSTGLDDLLIRRGYLDWPKELRGHNFMNSDIAYSEFYSRLMVEPIMGMKLRKALDGCDGDVVGIYGGYHLRKDSQIHAVLSLDFPPLSDSDVFSSGDLKKVDYIWIDQDLD